MGNLGCSQRSHMGRPYIPYGPSFLGTADFWYYFLRTTINLMTITYLEATLLTEVNLNYRAIFELQNTCQARPSMPIVLIIAHSWPSHPARLRS